MAVSNYAAPAASRLLDILELLVAEDEGLSLAEISRRLTISANSVFRICRVLEERGYLLRDGRSGAMQLSNKLCILGSRLGSRMTLVHHAARWLAWLSERSGENAHLCVLHDDRLVLLDQVVSTHPVRVVVETGSLLYPHASAFGKVILALMPAADQAKMLARAWPQLTPYTHTNAAQLAAEWVKVRQRRLAYDDEEHQVGVRCVGAPVFDRTGAVVAGMGIMGPAYRMTPERMMGYEPLVREAAAQVSLALGVPDTTVVEEGATHVSRLMPSVR
jgi:IclR family acetate operon transcriptional repressor